MSIALNDVSAGLARGLNLEVLKVDKFPEFLEKGILYFYSRESDYFTVLHFKIFGAQRCEKEANANIESLMNENPNFIRVEGIVLDTGKDDKEENKTTTYSFNISFRKP